MSNLNYTPGLGNLPFGNMNTNPQGSNYQADSAATVVESNLIAKAIASVIYDAAPKQFTALKLLAMTGFEDVNLDEFEYLEKTFGRSPLVANANSSAVAASAGSSVTQTLTVTTASLDEISRNMIIIYPDGTHGNVTAISGNDLTVRSVTNQGLPAITSGQLFAIQGTLKADGTDKFYHYDRLKTITRYNYVQFFFRAKRWARIEMQKYINAGTTNFLDEDKMEQIKQIRIDMFNSYWNGVRGEYAMADGYVGKAMGGIYPSMIAAGAINVTTSLGGLQATFETAVLATNHKAEGATRFVYGTDESLLDLSKIYKEEKTRYEPNDRVAKLGLSAIEIGSSMYVLVPCELWRENSCFEAGWKNRLIILDQETVKPVKMKGLPQVREGKTDNLANGTFLDYTDNWIEAQMSIKFHNPLASAIINISK